MAQRRLYTCNNSQQKRRSMMTFLRNRLFLGGIVLGGACGIVVGSVIAFTLGESSVSALRRALQERNRGRIPTEYLSQ